MMATFYKTGTKKSPAAPELTGQSAPPVITASFLLSLVLLFAGSLALQLAHHFLCDHAMVMFGFDGKHYLATSQAMTGALLKLFHGDWTAFFATIAGEAFGKNLIWDGPIIPGIPALFFALLGRLPAESDWSYFAVFFSVLASYSAVLVAVCGRLISGSSRLGITAGLLFALYPTTLLATGVYRSEILAIALMLTMVLALYRAPASVFAAVLAGITGGVFAMVKPVMIPAIGLLCLFTGFHTSPERRAKTGKSGMALRGKLLLVLAAAGLLTILSWSIYTAVDCHKFSITAERGPSYNAGVGTDIAADGWCTMPETAHVAKAKQSNSPMAVFAAQWKAHPFELAKLTLRRVTRLWANPWNDFREAVFGIPVQAQVIWHMILVLAGFMGLALYSCFPPDKNQFGIRGGNVRLLGNLAAIALLSHLSFIMFQTMGRYAYTSMPLLALFAACGLAALHRHAVSLQAGRGEAIVARAAAFAGAAFALLIFNCDALTHQGDWSEQSHILHPGQSACRSLDLSSLAADLEPGRRGEVAILVDCDIKQPDGLELRLNGHPLRRPLLPFNCLAGQNYFLFDTMAEHAAFMRTRVENFRQWRAVLVGKDAELLTRDGINELELINSGNTDVTIYGDRPPAGKKAVATEPGEEQGEGGLLLPSPDYFASDRMLVTLGSNESRIKTLGPAAVVPSRSYLKSASGQTRLARALPDALRIELAVAKSDDSAASDQSSGASLSESAGANRKTDLEYDISNKSFSWFARTADGIVVNKAVLRGVGTVTCEVDLKTLQNHPCTQLAIKLSGRARCLGGAGRLGVSAGLLGDKGVYQGLGQFADCVSLPRVSPGGAWTDFALNDVVPLYRLGGVAHVDKLAIGFLPCPRLESCYGAGRQCSNIEVKDLHVSVECLQLTDLAGRQVKVY